MPCATPCPNCARKGLPILFTRYAAAYSAQAEGMAALEGLQPAGHLQTKPSGVTLQTARYNVRLLRPGYLYVRIKRVGLAREWMGYAVHPHGYLSEFPVALPAEARSNPACEVEIRGATKSLVWVPDAKRVESLHYLFHPDPIDYQHLMDVIEPNPGKYAQRFDVAGWFNGNMSQPDTAKPSQLDGQVVEFAALSNATLRDAIEPQMYGLMGANAQEREWGPYEHTTPARQFAQTAGGAATGLPGGPHTETIRQLPYAAQHGPRLKKIAEFLEINKGAVVACEDAIGIAQELGQLQAEAQSIYTYWQADSSSGQHKDVSNEWVFQTAVATQGLMDLAEKGAVARVEKGFEESSRLQAPLPHDPDQAAQERARRDAARAANRQRELANVRTAVKAACDRLFDQSAARDILEAQKVHQVQAQEKVAAVGRDQNAWLRADKLRDAVARFSAQDEKIDRLGGGAALSLQIAQCLNGTETHEAGRKLLQEMAPWGNNLLSRMLCFNSESLKAAYRAIEDVKRPAEPTPTPDPDPDPESRLADLLSNVLKLTAGRLALGDKALGFIEEASKNDAPAVLRRMAWAGHVFSLLSARAMYGINALPASAMEARLVQTLALAGMSTMGSTVQKEAEQLRVDVTENAKRMALRAKKLQEAADPATRAGKAAALNRARSAAPGTRAAMLGGLFDMSSAIIKGNQFGTKLDARSGFDLLGQTLQGIGSLYDWRAKAYEETVFKGVKGTDLYKYSSLSEGLDAVKTAHLKSLRLTAFKFLAPAAVLSAVLDGTDAWNSSKRGRYGIAAWQGLSVLGTVFTIGGAAAGIVATGMGTGAVIWSAIAATLGLLGAVLAIGAAIFILVLYEDQWVTWLRDIPLNKERRGEKPIHKNLQETLQELANAQRSLQPT